MINKIDFNSQFSMDHQDYLRGINLSNWYRHYFIIKEVIKEKPKNILEIGVGNKVVKNCLSKTIKEYKTMDLNQKLDPDILSDIRDFHSRLREKFDCLICAEVLEHMPFSDLEKNLTNIYNYLSKGGRALITIPHRRARVMIVTPLSYQKALIIELPSWLKSGPKSFYRQIIKKKVRIDPHHCWEIGDGRIKKNDVETVFKKVGFVVKKSLKLLHIDFWVLRKN